jgi:hypothetical protein
MKKITAKISDFTVILFEGIICSLLFLLFIFNFPQESRVIAVACNLIKYSKHFILAAHDMNGKVIDHITTDQVILHDKRGDVDSLDKFSMF